MKKKAKAKSSKVAVQVETRGYREVVSVGGVNSDWAVTLTSEDSDVWQNAWLLTSRVRDLFRCNPLYQKYREVLWANVFGEHGLMLRMKVKEKEDRVVYAPDEKAALLVHERRMNRIIAWANRHDGGSRENYRAMKLAEVLDRERCALSEILRAQASVQVGEPDIYANQLIEKRWLDWQQAKYSDVRKQRDYKVHRQLRLISAVRDGDFFIRMIRNPKVNAYGFTLQMINAEWCDRFYNTTLPNGNEVRMGIEYRETDWGIGEVVAYYFIKRQPQDWQFSIPGAFNFTSKEMHIRVAADEIIHYCRSVDADGTRPAPWAAATIPQARHLNQYEIYEVIAAREAARKVGFFYSDIVPEGGVDPSLIDPRTGLPQMDGSPGGYYALKHGVKVEMIDPKHPTANYEAFRKAEVRSICAGLPGSDYSTMANDYEAINFSAGRLQRLDSNEMFFNIQRNDIDRAENVIFENWLEMALITDAIPLPAEKFEKFNSKVFQGRRFGGVDEQKECTAAALRMANKLSSPQIECAALGRDCEEILMDLAEYEMMCDELGLDSTFTVQTPQPKDPKDDDGEDPPATAKKPKPKGDGPKGGKTETAKLEIVEEEAALA